MPAPQCPLVPLPYSHIYEISNMTLVSCSSFMCYLVSLRSALFLWSTLRNVTLWLNCVQPHREMFKQCMLLDAAFYCGSLRPHVDGWRSVACSLCFPHLSTSVLPTWFVALYLQFQFHINVCPLHVRILWHSTLISTYGPNSAPYVCVLFLWPCWHYFWYLNCRSCI